jgi:5-methylcytosine-specific restriction endonuclease McrA
MTPSSQKPKNYLTCEVVKTREQAREDGDVRFFNGHPCSHGHLSDRYVKSNFCAQCSSERAAQGYAKNRDQICARVREYANANKERVLADKRRYHKENSDVLKAKKAEYYLRNREHIMQKSSRRYNEKKESILERERQRRKDFPSLFREQNRRLYERHREAISRRAKQYRKDKPEAKRALNASYRARKRNAKGKFCSEDIFRMLQEQDHLCLGCSADLKEVTYHIDHILPLKLGGSNEPHNIQLLCASCNCSKGDKHPNDWIPKNPPPKKDTPSE